MESMGRRKVRIIVSFKKEIEYLKSISVRQENDIFYGFILSNLVSLLLDDSDTRNNSDDSLELVRESLYIHFGDIETAAKVTDILIDMLVAELTSHIPDLDHPKYKNILTYTIASDYIMINIG